MELMFVFILIQSLQLSIAPGKKEFSQKFVMGNQQLKSNQNQLFKIQDWQPIQWEPFTNIKDPTYSSNFTVLANKNNQNWQIEKYQLFFNSQAQYISYLETYYERKKYPTLVNSVHIEQTTKKGMCSTFHSANVYLQRIHFRLFELIQIPVEEGLFMLDSALDGYQKMFQKTGYFDVSSDMIGVNKVGKVKVWVNKNFSKNFPEFNKIDHNKNQSDFVIALVKMIESCIDFPKNKQTLSQFMNRNKFNVTFSSARNEIKQYLKVNRLCGQKSMKSILLWIKKNYSRSICSSSQIIGSQLRSSSFSNEFDDYQKIRQRDKQKQRNRQIQQAQKLKRNTESQAVAMSKRKTQIIASNIPKNVSGSYSNRQMNRNPKVCFNQNPQINLNLNSNYKQNNFIPQYQMSNIYSQNQNIQLNNNRVFIQYPIHKEPIPVANMYPHPTLLAANTFLHVNAANKQRQGSYYSNNKQRDNQCEKNIKQPERFSANNQTLLLMRNDRKMEDKTIAAPNRNLNSKPSFASNDNSSYNITLNGSTNKQPITYPGNPNNISNQNGFFKPGSGLYSPQNLEAKPSDWFPNKKVAETTHKQKIRQKVKERQKRSQFSKSLTLNLNEDYDKKLPIYYTGMETYQIDPDIVKDLHSFQDSKN